MSKLDKDKINEQCKLLSDKIQIGHLMAVLDFTDIRTAIKWCKSKSIYVFKLGKLMYVNLMDFELVIERPFIESLKIKYPLNWKEIYDAYKKGDYQLLLEFMFQNTSVSKRKFAVEGTSANDFIEKMQQKFGKNG